MQSDKTLFLHDVLFAPNIRRNLVFVLVLIKLDFESRFHGQGVDLVLGQQYYGSGYFFDGFIALDIEHGENNEFFSYTTPSDNYENNVEVWHARLGHIGQSQINRLAKEGLLRNLKKVELSTNEHCLTGKTTRKPFEK